MAYEKKRERTKTRSGKRKNVKDVDWILKKKELYRARGKADVPRDSKWVLDGSCSPRTLLTHSSLATGTRQGAGNLDSDSPGPPIFRFHFASSLSSFCTSLPRACKIAHVIVRVFIQEYRKEERARVGSRARWMRHTTGDERKIRGTRLYTEKAKCSRERRGCSLVVATSRRSWRRRGHGSLSNGGEGHCRRRGKDGSAPGE